LVDHEHEIKKEAPIEKLVYAKSSLCILGSQPFYTTFKGVLEEIYHITHDSVASPPLERLLVHLFQEIPLPLPGMEVRFTLRERTFSCALPAIQQFDLTDVRFVIALIVIIIYLLYILLYYII
jgi:hypothetical protein